MRSILIASVLTCACAVPSWAAHDTSGNGAIDTAEIESLTGAKGKLDDKEHVFKVSAPRTDLHVVAGGVRITPPMGLTSWAAFQRSGEDTIVMGDLVLEEAQVNPVMSAALDNGLDVTALHNHFVATSPNVMFMHVGGHGEEKKLAEAVGKVFAEIKRTSGATAPQRPEIDPAKSTLDPKKLDAILGSEGDFKDGVYKAVFGRHTTMHGRKVGSAMGVNTWAAFAGSDDQAVVDGDFAMLESELQPVLRRLRGAAIDVVAIHQHMSGEQPRILFLHYWGIGKAEDLAKGVRGALDATRRD
jgi:hypothetical protein